MNVLGMEEPGVRAQMHPAGLWRHKKKKPFDVHNPKAWVSEYMKRVHTKSLSERDLQTPRWGGPPQQGQCSEESTGWAGAGLGRVSWVSIHPMAESGEKHRGSEVTEHKRGRRHSVFRYV